MNRTQWFIIGFWFMLTGLLAFISNTGNYSFNSLAPEVYLARNLRFNIIFLYSQLTMTIGVSCICCGLTNNNK